jgi:hypothetical protein
MSLFLRENRRLRRALFSVGQTCSLLYRRLVACQAHYHYGASNIGSAPDHSNAAPLRTDCRLQVCDTADCKSALHLRAATARGTFGSWRSSVFRLLVVGDFLHFSGG